MSNEFQKVSGKHEAIFKQAIYLNTVVKENFSVYA